MSRSGSAVLVSGGTSGLGRAIVEALAARGHQMFTCGRDAARLTEVGKVPGVSAFQVDVSDEPGVRRLSRSCWWWAARRSSRASRAHSTRLTASKMALLAYSTGLRQELMVLHPGARVVHLKVGAHETGLEHDGDKAGRNLAAYGPPYDAIAPKLAAKLNSDFKMVSHCPASDVAGAVCKLIATPAAQMPRDVRINVSFLERLVCWLPAWVLDMSDVGKLQ
jgi:NAD(P)-dependent dehydrogenase (short-subunit alcohol dehydrogenase family)